MVWTLGDVPSIGLVLESACGGGPGNVRRGGFTGRWSRPASNDGRGWRARRVKFLEKLCFQLEDGRKAADEEIARLLGEVRSVTICADEEMVL